MSGDVVIVHDYLTQRGGAERVVLSLLHTFPDARIVTSVYNPDSTFPEFKDANIETSWLQRFPAIRRDPRKALPLLAKTFSGIRIGEAAAVVCSSSGWAHGVRTTAPKLVYCHNPARWLYQAEDYLFGQKPYARAVAQAITPHLLRWDHRAAHSATRYLANSRTVQERISNTYDIFAEVVHPPVTIEPAAPSEPIAGLSPGFLLTIGRDRAYKNTPRVCAAAAAIEGLRLVVVGELPDPPAGSQWPSRLRAVPDVTDAQLRWLYANCSGLVAVSREDFGLTPIEANAFGKPVAVLRAGGFLDTLVPGITGVFIENEEISCIRAGLLELANRSWNKTLIETLAKRFSLDAFSSQIRSHVAELVAGPETFAPSARRFLSTDSTIAGHGHDRSKVVPASFPV